jgi:hypothetical protein
MALYHKRNQQLKFLKLLLHKDHQMSPQKPEMEQSRMQPMSSKFKEVKKLKMLKELLKDIMMPQRILPHNQLTLNNKLITLEEEESMPQEMLLDGECKLALTIPSTQLVMTRRLPPL